MDTGLLYRIVRIAAFVVSAVVLVLGIIDLVNLLDYNGANALGTSRGISLIIIILTMFLGSYGSYHQDRSYLIVAALILLVAVIVGFTDRNKHFVTPGVSILLIVLYLVQSESVRRNWL